MGSSGRHRYRRLITETRIAMKPTKPTRSDGQFVLRTIATDGNSSRYVNREPICVNPSDYLSGYIGYAVVYSALDSRADKVRFWSTILKQPVEVVELPKINGLAVDDKVEFEDLEAGLVRKGRVSFIDPEKQAISVVVGKSLRVFLRNDKTNGRYFCPALKADAEQAKAHL